MKLSKRLSCIAGYIEAGSRPADVGSDHAEVPIYLLSVGKVTFCEAIENKPGPFQRMRAAIDAEGLTDRCLASLSEGLSSLDPRINALILAGMGGTLIIKILTEHQEKLAQVETLVIDAHRDASAVRQTLAQFGYALSQEAVIYEEGIYYDVMKWKKASGPISYSEDELAFGPINLSEKSPLWLDSLAEERGRLLKILAELPEEKREGCAKKIAKIDEVSKR